jgi:hypothetical protein
MGKGSSLRRIGGAAMVASAFALVIAPGAGAKTLRTGYQPGAWTASKSHGGLCLESLTCPSVSTSEAGKAPTLLHTQLGSLTGVGATTTVQWTSAAFKYTGAAGKRSTNVQFVGKRGSNTDALLSVAGNSATYSVDLVSSKTGNTVAEAVSNGQLSPTSRLNRIGPKPMVGAVRRGHTYQLRITERFENGAEVIPGATVDFKRARIVARRHVHG